MKKYIFLEETFHRGSLFKKGDIVVEKDFMNYMDIEELCRLQSLAQHTHKLQEAMSKEPDPYKSVLIEEVKKRSKKE